LLSRWLSHEDGTLWRASSYRFHALLATQWRKGRVFIAGDAAHQQPPFIGQGMCQGLRDVANLAWKLAAVHAGKADPALLDSYEIERKQHVLTLTTRIKAIGHAICERDPAAARARDTALLASGGGQAPTVTRQEIVPPLEAGFLGEPQAAASGVLFPQPWIETSDGARLMDEIIGAGWRIVWDGRRGPPGEAPPFISAIVVGGDHHASLHERDGVLAAWFDLHECAAAIVRPDHYVYATPSQAADAAPMLEQLARRLAGARS
jgi:3-(3-hydroxy-phenyl)propionate hydroxylase